MATNQAVFQSTAHSSTGRSSECCHTSVAQVVDHSRPLC
jgi:hypothetical protein